MADTKSEVTIGGSGLGMTLLTGMFVWLKVENKIDWSWWWVFAPLWGPVAIVLGVLAIVGIGALVVAWLEM
jgi:hypothetical protein